jgi:hypothetical protein
MVHVHSDADAPNVVPGELKCRFNFRYSTQWTHQTLAKMVEDTLQNLGIKYELKWKVAGEPFLTREGALTSAVVDAIKEETGVAPELSTSGGTSDGRFIAPYGVDVVEIGPINATIHKVNEEVLVEDLLRLEKIYFRIASGEPQFFVDHDSWMLPRSETEYRKGIEGFRRYRDRLSGLGTTEAQFYARADNLREWLAQVEKRLGSLSRRLGDSVATSVINTDLAGDRAAEANTTLADNVQVKTSWFEIDDVFFEARGTSFALVHFFRAAEFDFAQVLEDKNARASVRQIIRELEASLQPLRSPLILNGGGFGLFANHSLVMANYMARANAAVINLRELLDQG